jgi:hypothetical protein
LIAGWMANLTIPLDKEINIGTVKTLEESKEAMLIMGELCGLLTWTANEILDEQISRGYFDQ